MTDRPQAYRAAEDFLEDHEDAESTLETVLAADEGTDAWEFSDVELDSGTFGEVVSAGVVEKEDGAYHVPDRAAVEAALEGKEFETADENSGFEFEFDMDYAKFGGLFGALLVVVAARTFYYRSVFVEGRVVSPGNDPYFYRYWQEQLIAQSSGPFDFSVLVNPPWDDGSFNQRPLTHATNWWFTELLGGDQWAADMVAAFLPLVFTVLLAIVVYYLALVLTRDYRVGVVSVLVLALAPIHANYTGLGLLHHRYNQYFWFGCILLTLAWLGTDLVRRHERIGLETAVDERIRSRKTWAVALAFGLVFAAWTHSWGGSLELFVGLGAFVAVRVCLDVREGVSPEMVNLPLVFGFGVGSGLAMVIHVGLGWHGLPGPALAVVTFIGVVAVVGLGELWHRQGWTPRSLLVIQPALGIVSLVGVVVSIGAMSEVANTVLASLESSNAPRWQVSTQSTTLYSPENFIIFGPIAQIGLEFYVGVAMLGWLAFYLYREYDPAWLLIGVITVHYLVVSGIQVRFAGRLVIVMAVLAGLGVVYLLSAVGLIENPFPIRGASSRSEGSDSGLVGGSISGSLSFHRAGRILSVGLLIFGASLIFVPTLMGQVANDPAHVETAMEISNNSESLDREYPENHVLAPWGEYRLYNYFVSGESEDERLGRYGYMPLFVDEDIDGRLNGYTDRIGYLVLAGGPVEIPTERDQARLSDQLGLDDDRFESLERYRLVSLDEESDIAVFSVVPGAQLKVDGVEEERVLVETNVSVSNRTFTYSQNVSVGDEGAVSVRVPYPGTYEIAGKSVSVSEEDVMDRRSVDG